MRLLQSGRNTPWLNSALWVLVSLLITVLVVRGAASSPLRIDAEVFYLAGQAVQRGISPYDITAWPALWREVYGTDHVPGRIFGYLPTFLPLVWLSSALDWPTVRLLIDVGNAAMTGLIAWGLAGLLQHVAPALPEWRRALAVALACTVGAVSATITLGQSSLLVMAGMVWLLRCGLERRSAWLFALCVVVVSIKPHLSLLPGLLVVVFLASRRQVALGGAVVVAMVVGTLAWLGTGVIPEFLAMLRHYKTFPMNTAESMSGLGNLTALVHLEVPLSVSVLLPLVVVVCALFLWRRRVPDGARSPAAAGSPFVPWLLPAGELPVEPQRRADVVRVVSLTWLLSEASLSLHTYDHVMLMLPMALLLLEGPLVIAAMLPAMLVVARPALLSPLLDAGLSQDRIQSVGLIYLAVASVLLFLGRRAWSPAAGR